ncbi:hypothetical protein PUN28_006840 [Cardiocondyla obscurior]|uniref:Uncharacterized protein n=1 Tax=Cardiocondyla obscurior TaxID=286306 RepID=A0AAW2G5Z6_9HYME
MLREQRESVHSRYFDCRGRFCKLERTARLEKNDKLLAASLAFCMQSLSLSRLPSAESMKLFLREIYKVGDSNKLSLIYSSPTLDFILQSSQIIRIYDSYEIRKASMQTNFITFVSRREKVETRFFFFHVFRQSDGSIVSYTRALYSKSGRRTQWLDACLFINIRAETAIAVDIVTYGHAEKHPCATFYT